MMKCFEAEQSIMKLLMISIGILLLLAVNAHAMGTAQPTTAIYRFYSNSEIYTVASGYYATATITYDGETLKNQQKLTGRGGFGMEITRERKIGGRITVEIKLYKNDNTHLATKNWSGNLSSSRNGFYWEYTPSGSGSYLFSGGYHFKSEGEHRRGGMIDVKVD